MIISFHDMKVEIFIDIMIYYIIYNLENIYYNSQIKDKYFHEDNIFLERNSSTQKK